MFLANMHLGRGKIYIFANYVKISSNGQRNFLPIFRQQILVNLVIISKLLIFNTTLREKIRNLTVPKILV